MHEVFIGKSAKKSTDYPIGHLLRRRKTVGDIGIEIECEASNSLPKPANGINSQPQVMPGMKHWSAVKDGSLRGADNCEYVLTKPIKFPQVEEALGELFDAFTAKGTVLDDSNRTSVHVHLNMQTFHLNRLAAFLGLYFSVEELLTQWCGEHRVGNLFCLRAKDAPAIVSSVKKFIESDGQYELGNNLHYAGLNANALTKYGSLEVRTLRGVTDKKVILDWVTMLRRIYDLSGDFSDPRNVCDHFSGGGPLAYLAFVLGDMADVLVHDISLSNQDVMSKLYDGIRLAQDICYCREWSDYKPVAITEDPFGRMMNPMMSFDSAMANHIAMNSSINSILSSATAPAGSNIESAYSAHWATVPAPSVEPDWEPEEYYEPVYNEPDEDEDGEEDEPEEEVEEITDDDYSY